MRHLLRRLPLLAALAVSLPALGQQANQDETQAINEIAQCLVEGLPSDWAVAHMVVELARPGAETGGVRYLVSRQDATDKFEPFNPCDTDRPPKLLISLRDQQPQERRGWSAARLIVQRDGNFRLNYDYPK